jgi:hypothetical protein
MGGVLGISGALQGAAKIISLFKADPTVKTQIQGELDLTALQGQIQDQLQQIAVDAAEASSKSVFVAGWRPFVGWVCGAALGYTYILQPFLQFVLAALHWQLNSAALPVLSTGELIPLLLSLLGLGAMRSYDKAQGNSPGVH